MFRRIILVVCSLLFLSAAPASAADSYGDIASQGEPRTGIVTFVTEFEVVTFEELARTGADNTVPLAQAGIVLLGGGSLLVLVARRRRAERRNSVG